MKIDFYAATTSCTALTTEVQTSPYTMPGDSSSDTTINAPSMLNGNALPNAPAES